MPKHQKIEFHIQLFLFMENEKIAVTSWDISLELCRRELTDYIPTPGSLTACLIQCSCHFMLAVIMFAVLTEIFFSFNKLWQGS